MLLKHIIDSQLFSWVYKKKGQIKHSLTGIKYYKTFFTNKVKLEENMTYVNMVCSVSLRKLRKLDSEGENKYFYVMLCL